MPLFPVCLTPIAPKGACRERAEEIATTVAITAAGNRKPAMTETALGRRSIDSGYCTRAFQKCLLNSRLETVVVIRLRRAGFAFQKVKVLE
jgi:hypothetical protein